LPPPGRQPQPRRCPCWGQDPNLPLTLRCNVDTVYQYQNPGHAEDTAEGEPFNAKRDLDILQKLGLVPGETLPARKLYDLLFERTSFTRDICGFGDGEARAPEWSICGGARNDAPYQKARAARLGIKM
jgi:hypothetical protein